uniref:Uncharacterized protein n=1 Tax=Anguilla anguilla TaxID=7936 RepID=A0A0E9SDA4_ANGAN
MVSHLFFSFLHKKNVPSIYKISSGCFKYTYNIHSCGV